MTASVSAVLENRLRSPLAGSFRRAVAFAAALHLAVPLTVVLGAKALQKPPQPIEFVSVRIVPAAKLGVEKPKPAPPQPPPPEPAKPEPLPEPKPETAAPVLPDPKAKAKKEAPKPAPAPAAAKPAESAEAATPPEGSATGAVAGLALGAPTATFDNPDFTYGYYVDQMLAQISRNWTRPLVGGGVEAWIHFEIERDGRLSDIRILRSSGINSFDLAALRAVQASSPLPPLPRAFRDDTLGVNLIVR